MIFRIKLISLWLKNVSLLTAYMIAKIVTILTPSVSGMFRVFRDCFDVVNASVSGLDLL